jgi:16S rRNA (adenine1518-N6/adenine1519-N6)-dimethyltransferase
MSRDPDDKPQAWDAPSAKDAATTDGLPRLGDVIRELQLSAKKSMGQNFILDLNLTRRIARECGRLAGRTVVEIGPGPGGLTRALLSEGAGRVLAVERDDRCLPALAQISAHYQGRLEVTSADALDVDWPKLLAGAGVTDKVIIAANLPYGLATKLLVGWLEAEPWPPWYDGMVLMFQKEVAERIVAEKGTKAYGRLAVISQWRTIPRIALTLPPSAFTPAPKVSSAVVVFQPRPVPMPVCSVRTLGQVTAAAFGQRRKMLRVSLKQITPMPELLLSRAGLAPELRGEQLAVADFANLAAILDDVRGSRS